MGLMTASEFRLPDLGEGVHEGQVLRVLVAEGEAVAEDQLLLEVETDKSAVEIPSPQAGTIARVHVSEGEVVNVGDVMISFDGGDAPSASVPAADMNAPATVAPTTVATPAPGRRAPASPAVRKVARDLKVDLATVEGTGPGGRIRREDVERAAQSPAAAPTAAAPSAPRPVAPAPRPAPATPTGKTGSDEFGPVTRETMSMTRRTIAGVMCEAVRTIPHVTDCDDADVTLLNDLRRGWNETNKPARKLGLLPFIVRAVARALQQHPIINASYDEAAGEIVYRRYYNIAIGVQTERGLVAPVLRDVDRMSVLEIDAALAELSEKARAGHLPREASQGATYTISNAGAMGGSRYATPIITPPQVAVLAIGKSRMQPWVVGDSIVPRLIMPLSHSMDHRVIDGAMEIAFMRDVIADLEAPARLML